MIPGYKAGSGNRPLTACCPNRDVFTSRKEIALALFTNVYNYLAFRRGVW